jgi:hypothetical protein
MDEVSWRNYVFRAYRNPYFWLPLLELLTESLRESCDGVFGGTVHGETVDNLVTSNATEINVFKMKVQK